MFLYFLIEVLLSNKDAAVEEPPFKIV